MSTNEKRERLAQLWAAFDLAGGRGIEIAEEIDLLTMEIEKDKLPALTNGQRESRTFTITLTGLQMEALDAWSNVTDPEPCYTHEDGEHGDLTECDGYAPEFSDALWAAYDVIERGWASAVPANDPDDMEEDPDAPDDGKMLIAGILYDRATGQEADPQ